MFAWSYVDMSTLDIDVVVHRFPLRPDSNPVKQKLRRKKPEWTVKIKEEVVKQYNAGFLEVVDCLKWFTNIVSVSKKNEKV